jgi:hypothetical protein
MASELSKLIEDELKNKGLALEDDDDQQVCYAMHMPGITSEPGQTPDLPNSSLTYVLILVPAVSMRLVPRAWLCDSYVQGLAELKCMLPSDHACACPPNHSTP